MVLRFFVQYKKTNFQDGLGGYDTRMSGMESPLQNYPQIFHFIQNVKIEIPRWQSTAIVIMTNAPIGTLRDWSFLKSLEEKWRQ